MRSPAPSSRAIDPPLLLAEFFSMVHPPVSFKPELLPDAYAAPPNPAVLLMNDDAVMSKGKIQIVELLREAGGNARQIPREEWLAEQND